MEISIGERSIVWGTRSVKKEGIAGKPVPGIVLIRLRPLSIMGFLGLSGLWFRSLRPPL